MNSFPIVQQEFKKVMFTWPYLFLFNLFLLAVLILATRLATCIHEFVGHALTASAFGGHVNGIRVSLFGGGHVYYHLKMESGLFVRFVVAFGGILVNMLSGLLPLMFVRRLAPRPMWALFSMLFGMVSLLGAIAYSALGFYYDQGDPVAWTKGPSPFGGWLWIPFIAVSPFISYFAAKSYVTLNERLFPARTFLSRFSIMVLTLGITGCVYAGLYGLTAQQSMALDAPSLAYQRAEKEVRDHKRNELHRRLRESHPELSETDVERMVERTPIVVKPHEVPKKFPLKPIIAILYSGGALLALRNVKKSMSSSLVRIDPRFVILAVVLAATALGVLAWTGGWLWRTIDVN